jgi:hypothetical protein
MVPAADGPNIKKSGESMRAKRLSAVQGPEQDDGNDDDRDIVIEDAENAREADSTAPSSERRWQALL